VLVTGTRAAERLARSAVRETVWRGATGLGLGLSTPLKPIFPKDGETNGASVADGAAIAKAPITFGALGLTVVNGAADAGRAKEATMPDETAITADALAAGFAEREIAAERDVAGFRRFGAR